VNGVVSETTSSKVKLFSANNEGSMQNILDELKMELTNETVTQRTNNIK
jgi:hypothetical protein